MGLLRSMVKDVVAALVVLALFFAVLGGPAVAQGGSLGYSAASDAGWCGDHPPGDDHHVPCHACRSDAVSLPRPPSIPRRLPKVLLGLFDAVPAPVERHDLPSPANRPRAPPALG